MQLAIESVKLPWVVAVDGSKFARSDAKQPLIPMEASR
jgi:hypothetical protein